MINGAFVPINLTGPCTVIGCGYHFNVNKTFKTIVTEKAKKFDIRKGNPPGLYPFRWHWSEQEMHKIYHFFKPMPEEPNDEPTIIGIVVFTLNSPSSPAVSNGNEYLAHQIIVKRQKKVTLQDQILIDEELHNELFQAIWTLYNPTTYPPVAEIDIDTNEIAPELEEEYIEQEKEADKKDREKINASNHQS